MSGLCCLVLFTLFSYGLAQNTSAVITVPFHNQIVEDSGTKNVNVDIDDVVIVTCEVTYSHGATWNISNVFEQTLFGNDMLANVTQNMFTMYLMRSFPINNPEMEFNITSLLWFYVNEVEDIIQKKEITIICSNPPEGTEEDRITVRLDSSPTCASYKREILLTSGILAIIHFGIMIV